MKNETEANWSLVDTCTKGVQSWQKPAPIRNGGSVPFWKKVLQWIF
jgi:hypothetical protein